MLYRAMSKMGELETSDGRPSGAIYGVLRMVKATIDELKPDKSFFVFDGSLSPLRKSVLPEYKANRMKREGTGELKKTIRGLLVSLGINTWLPDMEADDIIGLMTGQMDKVDKLIVVSSDTDFCQLMSDTVKVYNPIKKELLVSPVAPDKYVEYKAMVGDTADNIHGIKGIGPKKALAVIESDLPSVWAEEDGIRISKNRVVIAIPTEAKALKTYYPDTDFKIFSDEWKQFVENESKADFVKFIMACEHFEFKSILDSMSKWKETFGEKQDIDDVWQ